MDLDDIVNSLDPRVKVTTITGGEPLLQDLLPLAHRLKQMDHYIIVETSGTVRPDPELRKMVDVFSVSPKLSNAGFRFPYDLNEDWATYYKFVILNPEKDLEEVTGIVEKFRLKPSKIILQPDGNRKDYENALRELADAVTKNRLPYRVLPQFHRILSYR
jgi:organic radical activating enzyme